ncbi:hypothetical protein UCRPC4_g03707 [Phaeomoniella chlamydospora]|uniref:Uncharacterized protein n=1 Tax=Phaeomoniella chlamydospora TaxID=158046 RepID=A0A0G2EG88_PHACM|nr:hypothetical protein UCRPC4_g03707 [Phaeomoniella chlamydospora]
MSNSAAVGFITDDRRRCMVNYRGEYTPDVLGARIVQFLRDLRPEQIEACTVRVKDLTWVDGWDKPSVELQAEYSAKGFAQERFRGYNPGLGRYQSYLGVWTVLLKYATGSKILEPILTGDLRHLIDKTGDIEAGAPCQWAYFIDFENKVLETWNGWSKWCEVNSEDSGIWFHFPSRDQPVTIRMKRVDVTPFHLLTVEHMKALNSRYGPPTF